MDKETLIPILLIILILSGMCWLIYFHNKTTSDAEEECIMKCHRLEKNYMKYKDLLLNDECWCIEGSDSQRIY